MNLSVINGCVYWDYPGIGTGGQPVDKLRISLSRVRCIPDLLLSYDGNRNGWVISGTFYTKDMDGFQDKEVAFIPDADLDEDRFVEAKA